MLCSLGQGADTLACYECWLAQVSTIIHDCLQAVAIAVACSIGLKPCFFLLVLLATVFLRLCSMHKYYCDSHMLRMPVCLMPCLATANHAVQQPMSAGYARRDTKANQISLNFVLACACTG